MSFFKKVLFLLICTTLWFFFFVCTVKFMKDHPQYFGDCISDPAFWVVILLGAYFLNDTQE